GLAQIAAHCHAHRRRAAPTGRILVLFHDPFPGLALSGQPIGPAAVQRMRPVGAARRRCA
ncbi:MAG: hypothetical protein AAGL49_15665, partial [Pseudomonadota bacterium]